MQWILSDHSDRGENYGFVLPCWIKRSASEFRFTMGPKLWLLCQSKSRCGVQYMNCRSESSCRLSADPTDAYKTKEMTQRLKRYGEIAGQGCWDVFWQNYNSSCVTATVTLHNPPTPTPTPPLLVLLQRCCNICHGCRSFYSHFTAHHL